MSVNARVRTGLLLKCTEQGGKEERGERESSSFSANQSLIQLDCVGGSCLPLVKGNVSVLEDDQGMQSLFCLHPFKFTAKSNELRTNSGQ